MAVSDRIFIKVNGSDEYSPTYGTSKSLTEIHTKNGVLYPVNDLSSLRHTVLKTIDPNITAFNAIKSDTSTGFSNATYNVGGFPVNETFLHAVDPMMSGKIYKGGVDYPVMKPDMVYILDRYSKDYMNNKTSIATGDYQIGTFGSADGQFAGSGIIAVQAGGGGSGGSNPSGADCPGSGGGAGGSCLVYYRCTGNVILRVKVGGRGSAGGPSSNAGKGGDSSIFFAMGDVEYGVVCHGGKGGKSDTSDEGNSASLSGGGGGGVDAILRVKLPDGTYENSVTTQLIGGSSAASWNGKDTTVRQLCDGTGGVKLIVILSCAGAGGGGSDDTTSSSGGSAGASTSDITINVPYTLSNTTKTFTFPKKSGGSKGSSVSGAHAGGGGASLFNNGANGGGESNGNSGTSAKQGENGAGAGGAGAGDNYTWDGKKGGSGVVYYYK